MEATREIYWNVGHGVIGPMYFFAFVAIVVLLYGFYRRFATYERGKALNRLDHLPQRVSLLLKNTLAQVQVLRVPGPGSLHAFFFWGFGLLFIGTLLIMIQVDFTQPVFGQIFLKGTFYKLFSFILDAAGFIALIMLGGLLVRRFLFKPEGLETSSDDYLMHALLFTILVTGFVVEGVRIASTELRNNPGLAVFSPVGMLIGRLFLGMTAEALSVFHKRLWWVHFFLSMGFIAIIPYTKLRHIFTTSLIICSPICEPGGLSPPSTWRTRASSSSARPRSPILPGRTFSMPMPAQPASAARTAALPMPRTNRCLP